MTHVTVRPAQPVPGDGTEFARYFDIASDGLAQWMFGRRFHDALGRAFLEPGHDMSYEYVWFAEVEGAIAGMVSGYSAADHRRSQDGPLLRAAGLRAVRMLGTWLLARPLFEFMDRVRDGDWYLQAVAVGQEFRGRGIGSALLDHAEATATAADARRIVLDVAVDNDRARRLYERRGMVIEATSPSVALGPGHALHRMTKDL